jgi:Anti-sigma-28 factor, FlgM
VRSAAGSADTVTMNGVAPNGTISHKVAEIKRLVELGQYVVDPYEVADAMMRWAEREFDVDRRGLRSRGQNTCSNPRSSRATSVKVTSSCPSATTPIQASDVWAVGQAA